MQVEKVKNATAIHKIIVPARQHATWRESALPPISGMLPPPQTHHRSNPQNLVQLPLPSWRTATPNRTQLFLY